jgi:glycosyltransferase involved in cell wall biosynthesis
MGSSAVKPLAINHAIFQYLGRLDQREVVREMQKAHVLVLPAVSGGFGLVIDCRFENLQSNICYLRFAYE